MEQTIKQILNINVAPGTPNTGGLATGNTTSLSSIAESIGIIGCTILMTIVVALAIAGIASLFRYKKQQRKLSLCFGIGLTTLSLGLSIPALSMTSVALSSAKDNTLITNINIAKATAPQVATADTTITLDTEMKDGYTVYAYMDEDNALYNQDGSARITATGVDTTSDPDSISQNSYGIKNLVSNQYAPISASENEPLMVYTTHEAVAAGTNLNLTFAAKVDQSTPVGIYTGKITFMVVPATLYIQDVTPDVCATFETDQQVPVVDKRDGKTYNIAKLRDGRCWMTENLALGSETESTVLTPDTTDTDTTFVLPASSMRWEDDSVNVPEILIDRGETPISQKQQSQDNNKLETFYNWNAATAGAGNSSISPSEETTVENSICPSGWQLPQYGEERYSSINTTHNLDDNDYYTMLKHYLPDDLWASERGWHGATELAMQDPINFQLSGVVLFQDEQQLSNYDHDIYVYGRDYMGAWWFNTSYQNMYEPINSNEAMVSQQAHLLVSSYLIGDDSEFNSADPEPASGVFPFMEAPRTIGASIRCVMRNN